MKSFHLVITSLEGAKFDGEAESVTVPGSAGEMTLLADHEPLVSTLRKGTIMARSKSGEQEFEVARGVLECSGGNVTILI
ncbi:F0F1 ATP synthase subunit epsilon [Candidatus Kaiserbacteria bacterium]|nr:F0F1 ATP synthase subunit epsilon [Candidatus Kaiserbacteria bacterium]